MKVIAEGVRGTPQRGQVPATQLGKGLDMEETEHKLSLEGLEAGQTTGRRRGVQAERAGCTKAEEEDCIQGTADSLEGLKHGLGEQETPWWVLHACQAQEPELIPTGNGKPMMRFEQKLDVTQFASWRDLCGWCVRNGCLKVPWQQVNQLGHDRSSLNEKGGKLEPQ